MPTPRSDDTDGRRRIPRTDTLLAKPALALASDRLGPRIVKAAVIAAQQQARDGLIDPADVMQASISLLPERASSLRPVINATGVVVHTNLGRAPLSDAALDAVSAAAGATDVEFDLRTGKRTSRGAGALAALRSAVPAAGDAHVVNNGAAALALAACALASGREVVLSRGELVEIGDGFRIPELLESTGARLREVGTTNRTSTRDYAEAIGPNTGFVLKVHTSNFRIEGFTSSVPVGDLAVLTRPRGIPLVVDIGSGLLERDPLLPDEPDATTTLDAGATVVTASGDKLLGGPQAGLLLGDADTVRRLRRHPLARALRPDKLTYAALEATLNGPETPTHKALHADTAVLRRRAQALAAAVDGELSRVDDVVGGGAAPGLTLEGWAVSLPVALARPLRLGAPAVVGRVEHGRLLLDVRCVPAERDGELRDAVLAAMTAADSAVPR